MDLKIKKFEEVIKKKTKEELDEIPEDYYPNIRPPLMWNNPKIEKG